MRAARLLRFADCTPSLIPASASHKIAGVLVFFLAVAIAAPAQTYTALYSFCLQTNCPDGSRPTGGLVQGVDGNFYGTTVGGGSGGVGTVFKISASGMFTSLHSFTGADGLDPFAGLLLASDGNFYGTTVTGGFINNGSAFQMTPSGTVSQVYSFCSQQGCMGTTPYAGLVQGTDGNFYGTTQSGGGGGHCGPGCGTVFKLTPAGVLTTLHAFSGSDGASPYAGLVQANDGNFYGTTQTGGAATYCPSYVSSGCGTIFRITPGGTLTTVYNFCSLPNCADGYDPYAGLVQGSDGNLYGTSHYAPSSDGTIFKISLSGGLTILHTFHFFMDGANPIGTLIQATDGNFYGTTPSGTGQFGGTIFQMTPNGTVNTLYKFCTLAHCNDGSAPYGALLEATDGNLYGTASMGGNGCNGGFCGTVFKLSLGLTPFVTTQPTSGAVGTPVTILGTNLSGATSVTFNGTSASFNVISSSEITTTVPAGATTGVVKVTTPAGTLSSNTVFQVTGPLQIVPVIPCRLIDTRQTGGPIQGGSSRTFTVPPLGGCNIPASAAAYSLNVTVSPHHALGYLTIWPNGEIQPFVSTMNSTDGRVKANAAIVPAGNNAVSVYVSDTTDVILDIDAYFAAPSAQTYQFYSLPPCRLVDTRNGDGGTLQPARERDYTVAGHCGIPSSATAYSFNVTVIPTRGELDYLTVWPKGETQPFVSTLNDPTGTVVANAAIVPAGPHHATAFYAHDRPTDLLVDVNGYFAPAGAGGLSLYPVTPCRVLDTRGAGGPFMGEWNPPDGVNVLTSPCAPPNTSKAFVFNATVVPSGQMPYLTLWPHDTPQPNVSTLNAYDGFITSNMAIVPTNDGSIEAYAAGLTQLILDISGYFAP